MDPMHTRNQLAGLAALRKAIKQGDPAAGLSISFKVGANGTPRQISLAIGTDYVLETLERALVETLDFSQKLKVSEVSDIRKQIKDIGEALKQD